MLIQSLRFDLLLDPVYKNCIRKSTGRVRKDGISSWSRMLRSLPPIFFYLKQEKNGQDDAVSARRATNFPRHHRQPATVHLIPSRD
jgi:hypothetical protein